MIQLYRNIKSRRLELGMSQEELAYKVGYTDRTSIAKVESGKVDLSQSKILAFAEALNTSASDLMSWEETNQPASVSGAELTAEYVELFSRLTPEQRKLIVSQIKGILTSQ